MKREELLINAKPILFNTEMVRAILEDRKTIARRVIKTKLPEFLGFGYDWVSDDKAVFGFSEYGHLEAFKPKYQVGDILYVRETYRDVIVGLVGFEGEAMWTDDVIEYKASQKEFEEKYEGLIGEYSNWHPSIHMPKEAARIFLKVTNVRVERLQDIQNNNYEIDYHGTLASSNSFKEGAFMLGEFVDLWNSTINKQDLDAYGWEANPYVWVIEFEKVELLKE